MSTALGENTTTEAPMAAHGPVRDVGLLLTRALLGVIFIAHGWQKFVLNGLEGTATGFAEMGVPLPEVSAVVAGTIELGAGALLILGLLTPVAGVLAALIMAGAYWFAHRTEGIFAADGGWELVAALGLAAIVFAIVGPGRYSLDALRRRRRGRTA